MGFSFTSKSLDSCVVDGVATLACIPILIINIINFLLIFGGIVAVFLTGFAGIKFISSQGDPAKLDSARKTFFFAVIGLLFIFFSFFIVSFIGKITGVNQIPQ